MQREALLNDISSLTHQSLLQIPRNHKANQAYLRYLLWLGLAGTAYANDREFHLKTAWVPHFVGNTLALLFPELFYALDNLLHLDRRFRDAKVDVWTTLRATLDQVILKNPAYVEYIAPVTLAYIVSHPRFNIYRGEWAHLRLLGFGLDSIPHSASAYTISSFLYDLIDALQQNLVPGSPIASLVRWTARHRKLTTGAALGLLTLLYESGEYSIHRHELQVRHDDPSQINMMWDPVDTFFDVLSNTAGWAFATLRHRK